MQITDEALGELVSYLREKLPHEGCGVIAGKNSIASRVIPMKNEHHKPEEFWAFDPDDWMETNEEVEQAGEEVLCVFHSHVTKGPELSKTDVRNTFYIAGEVPWLVVSFAGEEPDVAVWMTKAGEVSPEPVEILPVHPKPEVDMTGVDIESLASEFVMLQGKQ